MNTEDSKCKEGNESNKLTFRMLLWSQGFISPNPPAEASRPAVPHRAFTSFTALWTTVTVPSVVYQVKESYRNASLDSHPTLSQTKCKLDEYLKTIIHFMYFLKIFTRKTNNSNFYLLNKSASFTSSISFPVSVLSSISLPVSLLFGGGIDAMLTSVFLPLLVSAAELFTNPSRVWGSFWASHTILPATKSIRQHYTIVRIRVCV